MKCISFQHLNKASPDFCALAIGTPGKKQKFKIHTGSVSEIALFTVHFQDKAEKFFFKICLVGILYLCLKVPKKMQQTLPFSGVFSVWDDWIEF